VKYKKVGRIIYYKNEFYSIHERFEVLAEKPINDLKDFVKSTATELKLFNLNVAKRILSLLSMQD
jgi:hypothetical protein